MAYLDKTGLTYLWGKIADVLKNYVKTDSLSKVATSGSYNDLSNKPSSLPANGGNADTVDNYHIVVSSSEPTTNDTKVITIVI